MRTPQNSEPGGGLLVHLSTAEKVGGLIAAILSILIIVGSSFSSIGAANEKLNNHETRITNLEKNQATIVQTKQEVDDMHDLWFPPQRKP
jgi:flagellin-like hook-associated protein FlgL